jgi:hypothetical protein
MMKKLFLLIFAIALIGSAVAQKSGLKAVPYGKASHPYTTKIMDFGTPTSIVANPTVLNRPKTTNFAIDTMWIGSSVNAFTLLVAQQRCMWYDVNLDAIMATYRGNNSTTYPLMAYLTGNDIVNNYSLDHGVTWGKKEGVADGTRHRYPSGVIHNPAGNSDINNSFAVMAGPETDGSNWTFTYKVSRKYDGTLLDIQKDVTSSNGELLRQGLTATEDGMVHFCGDAYTDDYTTSVLMIKNGEFNAGGTIDWTSVDINMANYINRRSNNELISFFGDAHMAWNNDGSVGYCFVRGSDNRPTIKPSWVPIIFKSTDAGATWNQLPYFDFATLTEITDWILPVGTDDNLYKPMFTDFGMTVDYLDKPHIFSIIRGCSSAHTDSLTYIWTYQLGGVTHDADCNYFEVWQDATDNWHAYHIDTCWTDDVTDAESFYTSSTGNVGWDHRLQATRSYDGTKVFATWGDTDYLFWGVDKFNLNPDLFIFGHDLTDDEMVGPQNVTNGSDIWGLSYFDFASPIAIQTAPADVLESYVLPITVEDITTTGSNADNPVYHIYTNGIQVDFNVGMNENQKANSIISACHPNPSTGRTSVDITLDKTSNVTLNIANVTGQTVATRNYTVESGTHKLSIDNSNLTSGVYFCTFTIGDQKYSTKMIVK